MYSELELENSQKRSAKLGNQHSITSRSLIVLSVTFKVHRTDYIYAYCYPYVPVHAGKIYTGSKTIDTLKGPIQSILVFLFTS